MSVAEGEQADSVTDNVPELTGEVVALPRSVLFACDDSEECEKGAELLFDTLVKEGQSTLRAGRFCLRPPCRYSTPVELLQIECC